MVWMRTQASGPWLLPRPLLSVHPNLKLAGGPHLCKGPWGWRGGDIRSRRAYPPWPTQNSILQPLLLLRPPPGRARKDRQTRPEVRPALAL